MIDVPSPVIAGNPAAFPQSFADEVLGPVVLYQLSQGEIAMPEAVTFDIVAPVPIEWQMIFQVSYCDPSNNVLWKTSSPNLEVD